MAKLVIWEVTDGNNEPVQKQAVCTTKLARRTAQAQAQEEAGSYQVATPRKAKPSATQRNRRCRRKSVRALAPSY